MSNLLTSASFIGDVNIPNNTEVKVVEKINYFIEKSEPKCLLDLFGYRLYKAYVADASPQRMLDLIDGKEFTDINGNLKKTGKLIDIVKYYVYFDIMEASATQTTGVNTSIQKGNNARIESPWDKMTQAWNTMSENAYLLLHFLRMDGYATTATYPEFTYNDFVKAHRLFRKIGL